MRGVLHGAVALGVWGIAPCKTLAGVPGQLLKSASLSVLVLPPAWVLARCLTRGTALMLQSTHCVAWGTNQTVVSPTWQGGQAGAARRDGAVKPPLDLSKGHKPPLHPPPPAICCLAGVMISPRFDLWAYRQVGGRRGALLAGIAKTTRRMSRLASLNVQRAKPQILAGMLGPLTSNQP